MSRPAIPDEHEFALLLTHDVDRPYKTYQSVYFALTERDPSHLRSALPTVNPYWQFENIMGLETDLGVRSAFYFLSEQRLFRDRPVREWATIDGWKLYAGRYDLDDPSIQSVLHRLDEGGWEIGLHGSYNSFDDPTRLRWEKARLERLLGHGVLGGRQHYLNLDRPRTWRIHADLGLGYDASLGSSTTYGFQHGYDPIRPFGDEFVVFPLTLMEKTLPDPATAPEDAWEVCQRLLDEARENEAVMTALWHPRYFSQTDFPGYVSLYRRLVERAQEMGAWVGPPQTLYEHLDPLTLDGSSDACSSRDTSCSDGSLPHGSAVGHSFEDASEKVIKG